MSRAPIERGPQAEIKAPLGGPAVWGRPLGESWPMAERDRLPRGMTPPAPNLRMPRAYLVINVDGIAEMMRQAQQRWDQRLQGDKADG